ncbi:MAG: hypothetical protein GY820_25635 [Gammaproteobacteria bacterium]|nr:hypothetical protein [Gammaproteobacteria bacterium]
MGQFGIAFLGFNPAPTVIWLIELIILWASVTFDLQNVTFFMHLSGTVCSQQHFLS